MYITQLLEAKEHIQMQVTPYSRSPGRHVLYLGSECHPQIEIEASERSISIGVGLFRHGTVSRTSLALYARHIRRFPRQTVRLRFARLFDWTELVTRSK